MRISRIYTDQILKAGQALKLASKASHHLAVVLRVKVGSRIILFNNSACEFPAEIIESNKRAVTVNIVERIETSTESPLAIHLAISISKGDRMDLVIQKATELGVTEITPLTTERTNVKLKADRLKKKQQHWQQVAISACEQCGRNKVPRINTLTSANHWLNTVEAKHKFVLHHRTDKTLSELSPTNSIALFIGPEGGLTADEIKLAEQQGFHALALGPRVLRTETAPLAAISILQYVWGDM